MPCAEGSEEADSEEEQARGHGRGKNVGSNARPQRAAAVRTNKRLKVTDRLRQRGEGPFAV
jgi:hypothetical protein